MLLKAHSQYHITKHFTGPNQGAKYKEKKKSEFLIGFYNDQNKNVLPIFLVYLG